MLVGLLNFIFNTLVFLVNIAGWLLVIYVILALVMPDNKYTLLAGKYIEPVLAPIRALLNKAFPKLAGLRVDISPVVLWLLLEIVRWLLLLLQSILL